MKEYEIMYLVKPNYGNEQYEEIEKKMLSWLEKGKGKIIFSEKWGLRDLATKLDKYDRAYYIITRFEGDNETLKNLKNQLKISEDIFRYMIIDAKSLPKIAKSKEV